MQLIKLNGECNLCGERVRIAREAAGLSQEQLAAKLQLLDYAITQKAVSRIETGARTVHDYEVPLLAAALNVTPLWLLYLEDQ